MHDCGDKDAFGTSVIPSAIHLATTFDHVTGSK